MEKRLLMEREKAAEWAQHMTQQLSIEELAVRPGEKYAPWCVRLGKLPLTFEISFPEEFPFKEPVIIFANAPATRDSGATAASDMVVPCSSFIEWSPAQRIFKLLQAIEGELAWPLERIRVEARAIRESTPPWLVELSEPELAAAWLQGSGSARPEHVLLDAAGCTHGPKRVDVVLRGSAPYDTDIRVSLLLPGVAGLGVEGASRAYPAALPDITFRSFAPHVLKRPDFKVEFQEFFRPLAPDFSLARTLERISLAFLQPTCPANFVRSLPRIEPYEPSWEGWAAFKKDKQDKVEQYARSGTAVHACFFRRAESILPLLDMELQHALLLPSHARGDALRTLCRSTEVAGVFSIAMFPLSTCQMILDEVENFERVASEQRWFPTRPNSMNSYGTIINDIGMEPWVDRLQEEVLAPIARLLYPHEGADLDEHHTFTVKYSPDTDRKLDMHHDDSDVTFNINLGKEFEGAGLTFCGMLGEPRHRKLSGKIQHTPGTCIVHLGAHRHGADEITKGERVNLIVWNTNYVFRESQHSRHRQWQKLVQDGLYKQEEGPPDVECISDTHDRKGTGLGWCPPPGFECTS